MNLLCEFDVSSGRASALSVVGNHWEGHVRALVLRLVCVIWRDAAVNPLHVNFPLAGVFHVSTWVDKCHGEILWAEG